MSAAAQLDLYIVPYPAAPDLAGYQAELDPAELERAGRFQFPRLRDFYLFSHGTLRRILSSYTQTSPGEIAFVYGEKGKPSLISHPDLHFNASHSGDLLVCAVSYIEGERARDKGASDFLIAKDVENTRDARTRRDRPLPSIGVDVEYLRPLSGADLASIPKQFFAPGEQARLAALPAEQQQRAFFECWTRKEAVIKATGEGVSRALHSFEVAFGPGTAPALLRLDNNPAPGWQMASLEPAPGYLAAIAAPYSWLPLKIKAFP